jgi:hypothetical protein
MPLELPVLPVLLDLLVPMVLLKVLVLPIPLELLALPVLLGLALLLTLLQVLASPTPLKWYVPLVSLDLPPRSRCCSRCCHCQCSWSCLCRLCQWTYPCATNTTQGVDTTNTVGSACAVSVAGLTALSVPLKVLVLSFLPEQPCAVMCTYTFLW